jgi:hypothetical protein
MANPKATKCRHCGEGGELYKGAHMKCHGEYCRKMAAMKRGPNKCRRCWVVIEAGVKLCSDCAVASRKEALRRYEAKRRPCKSCACGCGGELPRGFTGRFLPDHNPRLKQPQVRVRRRKVAQKKQHPMGQIVVGTPRERPFAEPGKPVIDQPPTNPRGVEPRRIPPVGAAGWSVAEARRFG